MPSVSCACSTTVSLGPNPVFHKHVVTYDEGVSAGLNIVPVDIDGDGDIDLITTGKWAVCDLREPDDRVGFDDERAARVKPTVPSRCRSTIWRSPRGAKASSDSELPGNTSAPRAQRRQTQHALRLPRDPLALCAHADAPLAEIKLAKPAVRRVIAHFADPNGYATAFEIQVKRRRTRPSTRPTKTTTASRSTSPSTRCRRHRAPCSAPIPTRLPQRRATQRTRSLRRVSETAT